MVVGLDEEGAVGQGLAEEVAGGVHCGADPPALKPLEDVLVNIVRQGGGDAAGQHQDVALLQLVEDGVEPLQRLGPDRGAEAVDLALLLRPDLDVDAGEARGQMKKAGGAAAGFHDSEEGKAMLRAWGIEGDYEGIGHCVLDVYKRQAHVGADEVDKLVGTYLSKTFESGYLRVGTKLLYGLYALPES